MKNQEVSAHSVSAHPQIIPEWIRIPPRGARCAFTGMTRGTIQDLVLARPCNRNTPPVKSCLVRQPGAKRGVRLVNLKSLLDHLEQLASHRPTTTASA